MNIENSNNQANKSIISVKIGNIKYNLSTNESDDYIKGIAKYINSKMDELSSIYDNLNKNSTSFLLVLALNIADDLFKQRQLFNRNSKLIEELESKINSLSNNNIELENKIKDSANLCNNKENSIKYLEDKIKDITKQKDDALSSLDKLKSLIADKDSIISKLESELNSKPDYDVTSSLQEKDETISILKKSLEEKDLIIDNLKDNLNETTIKLSNIPDIEELELEKDIKILELEEEIENLKSQLKNI